MSKWADDDKDGLHAYVVTTWNFGQSYDRIEYAESLKDAKAKFGWTRQLHTHKSVRRATREDVSA